MLIITELVNCEDEMLAPESIQRGKREDRSSNLSSGLAAQSRQNVTTKIQIQPIRDYFTYIFINFVEIRNDPTRHEYKCE